jgi:hypothetical protein
MQRAVELAIAAAIEAHPVAGAWRDDPRVGNVFAEVAWTARASVAEEAARRAAIGASRLSVVSKAQNRHVGRRDGLAPLVLRGNR